MEVIPAIDIRGGRCVRLVQGDYDRETVFADDPAAAATRWRDAGAGRLHVVDLDGAREGRPVNEDAIQRILGAVDVPVQLGGGLRAPDVVQRYLDAGVDRVVVGTAAVKDEAALSAMLERFPGRVLAGVDARNGIVVTDGWTDGSGIAVAEFVPRLAALGVERIVYTDTVQDGTLTQPNLAALESLLAADPALKVIYAGGVAKVEHLRRLAAAGAEGAIIGHALYTGDIDLAEALAVSREVA
jgi:phosphoribosylformimino-5-aminoimidazole carboxamide ribotide isomerase